MAKKLNNPKTGPIPDRVKVNKPWKEAMKDALAKKKPPEGWPKQKGWPKEK